MERLVALLATWSALWEVLTAASPPDAAGLVDALTGRPFTDGGGGDLWLQPAAVSPAGAVLVRRAAALVGGRYDTRTGRLRGCRVGLPADLWHGYAC